MRWSVKIARVAGTEIKIHITFLLFLLWIGFAYYLVGGPDAAIQGLVFIVLLMLCVVLHELGHVMAAKGFGINTPDITLLPFGGVARMQRMPEKPAQEIIVALAGPAVNVVIAGAILLFTGTRLDMSPGSLGPETALAMRLATVNIYLVLFNLLPAFPMDGGRVLRALIAIKLPYSRATRIAARIGQGFAFLFGFLGFFGNPMLILIALFVYIAASQEASLAEIKDLTGSLSVYDAMMTQFAVLSPNARIREAAEALLRTSQHEFPVVDSEGRVLGMLTRDDMIKALENSGLETPVANVMRRYVRLIRQNESLEQAFQLMQECECPALPVVNSLGRLVGIISLENVGELMMIRSALPKAASQAARSEQTA
jgi:Zn-dependent protease/CBS domain-containing protein